jgi:hypothetical protein
MLEKPLLVTVAVVLPVFVPPVLGLAVFPAFAAPVGRL